MLSIYNIVCKELVCISFYNEEAYEKSLMELFQNLGYNSFYGPNIERDYKNPLYMDDLEILYNINNHLDKKAVDKAIELIQDWGIGSLEEKNNKFNSHFYLKELNPCKQNIDNSFIIFIR